MTSIRTFVAVDVSDQVRAAAAEVRSDVERQAADGVDALRWVDPAKLHVTLRFLGDQSADTLADIVARFAPPWTLPGFDAAIDGVDWLPSRARPRVMIGRFTRGADEFRALRREVDRRLGEAVPDHDEGRVFAPHVTIARLRNTRLRLARRRTLVDMRPPFAASMHVDGVVLYASRPGKHGASYEPLSRNPLAPAGVR